MEMKHHLEEKLKQLKLAGMSYSLSMRIQEAQQNKLGYLDFLTLLIQDEINNRETNQLNRRIKSAGFKKEKTFEGYDFNFNVQAIPPATIRDYATCRFIELKQNLVIAGSPGIGKTHIAKAIGHEACRRGMRVIYRKTLDLLDTILTSKINLKYELLFKKCIKADLLIIDDFGIRKLDNKETEILYSIIDERLGNGATILTSNRPHDDWPGVFPDQVIGGAILDRLVSGSHKMLIKNARSYRKEGKKKDKIID